MPARPPALRHPDFRRLWTSILCSGIAMQMAQVAIGWQVYSIRHNAFDLGLIGLAEFAPVPLLALPAGAMADLVDRRTTSVIHRRPNSGANPRQKGSSKGSSLFRFQNLHFVTVHVGLNLPPKG